MITDSTCPHCNAPIDAQGCCVGLRREARRVYGSSELSTRIDVSGTPSPLSNTIDVSAVPSPLRNTISTQPPVIYLSAEERFRQQEAAGTNTITVSSTQRRQPVIGRQQRRANERRQRTARG